MFERLRKLYEQGKLSQKQLYYYVKKGIITEEQYQEIINGVGENE